MGAMRVRPGDCRVGFESAEIAARHAVAADLIDKAAEKSSPPEKIIGDSTAERNN
jgi:hypothetical protein